jgi:hypothetical protein
MENEIKEIDSGMNIKGIFCYQKLLEGFMREFYDRVDWETLDGDNKINEDIFNKMDRGCKLYMIMNYRGIWKIR